MKTPDADDDWYEVVETDWRKSVLGETADYCSSKQFCGEIEDFKEKYSYMFACQESKDADGEHKLEYTEAYNSYQSLVEGLLEDFVKGRDSNIRDFYSECRDALDGKFVALFEEHEHKWYVYITPHDMLYGNVIIAYVRTDRFVDILMSWLEYDAFYEMMCEYTLDRSRSHRK